MFSVVKGVVEKMIDRGSKVSVEDTGNTIILTIGDYIDSDSYSALPPVDRTLAVSVTKRKGWLWGSEYVVSSNGVIVMSQRDAKRLYKLMARAITHPKMREENKQKLLDYLGE